MAPIIHMESQVHPPSWVAGDTRQTRGSGGYVPQQWGAGGQMHIGGPMLLPRDVMDEGGFPASAPAGMTASRSLSRGVPAPMMGRDIGEGAFMGRGYSIKRCQGFVRCDMDIDAEVVGWVIGKNGSTIKDMKHKTGCNMWVDQRALKLTITGPDLAAVEHAAKSVDAYVAAAPIKAGAVEAAVTKTLECPGHLLDMLGDRTTIARIVKETHAQVVVNKKIGRIIVRGDHRSVELACSSVQTTIQAALHGGMGLRVNTPDGGYVGSGGGGSSSSVGPGISSLGIGGTSSGLSPNNMGGMFHRMVQTQSPHSPDHMSVMDIHELHNVQTWGLHDHTHHVIQHPRHNHHTRDVRGSDTDESEIETETVSLGSIGVRTPVSSTAGSPRGAPQPSLTTSPASITGSTPRGDWSLFSGGFGLGMAALHEGSSSASTPTTVTATRTTPRVHFPEGIQSMTATDLRECEEGKDEVPGVIGSSAPPPSPASTTSAGDLTRRARGALVDACALDALEASDDEEGEDIEDKVARLGKRLQAMGLGKYCDKFAENEVDLEALGLMSEGDLADIGIPKGPRLKILNAVGRGPSHTA